MGVVIFTDHAIKRCKQRGITLADVRKQLEGMPKLININHWDFENGIRVAIAQYPNHLIVLSVIRRGK